MPKEYHSYQSDVYIYISRFNVDTNNNITSKLLIPFTLFNILQITNIITLCFRLLIQR